MNLLPPLTPPLLPPPVLVPPAPRLTPPTLLPPPPGHVILSRPGSQSFRTTDTPPPPRTTTSSGNDWVQVVLEKPDDAYARVEFIAAGVDLHPGSLVPRNGALHIITATSGACVYRWRC